ncbi:MAG: PCP reductase family protein [Acidobacteria bacterium]|nr:PCP reductase family protein [Acidobacteriota bacterium]
MKFLCVSCNEAMKLREVNPPERGSLTVIYRCPKCAQEFAMLTNPYETQVVGSLGVKVGGESAEGVGESKCPFAGVVQGLTEEQGVANIEWTTEASTRLDKVPEFARPMAKVGIERYAKERGFTRVDAQVLDQAKEFFGM